MSAPKSGLFDLHGQVAVITGATGGLGRSIVAVFVAHGATVLLADRDASTCQVLADALTAAGGVASSVSCDLSHRASAEAVVDTALQRYGRIDTLVCNAGIQGPAGPLTDVPDTDWDAVMAVNLKSAWWLCARALPDMGKRGSGSVLLMASIAGLRGNRAIGLYGLSKAALTQMARNLAVEWGPCGVRVNAISPGLIRTPLANDLLVNEVFMARRLSLTPLRRVGQPHEVAGVAVMLASSAGGFITGQNIVIDGGTTIGDGS